LHHVIAGGQNLSTGFVGNGNIGNQAGIESLLQTAGSFGRSGPICLSPSKSA
jgi:hypothetical protein